MRVITSEAGCVGQDLAMARGFDSRFEKLPHARLNPSPHHAMVACLIWRRRAAEVSKPLADFFLSRKRHIRHKIS